MMGLGIQELVIVGIVAILLFGKRLPEVAKSWGKSYRDFRQGLSDIQAQFHDVDREYRSAVSSVRRVVEEDEHEQPTTARFEPPTAPRFEPPVTAPLVDPSDRGIAVDPSGSAVASAEPADRSGPTA